MYMISRMQKAKAAQRLKKGDFAPYRRFRLNNRMVLVFKPAREPKR